MLGVLLIYPHSPSGVARPRNRAYISVKPLAAVLKPINVATLYHVYAVNSVHEVCVCYLANVHVRLDLQ